MTPHSSFLYSVVDRYLLHASDSARIAFVFPTKRAGLFFEDLIRKDIRIRKPLYLPSLFSIEEFFEHLSPLRPIDDMEIIFSLYALYSDICHEAQIPVPDFADFYPWSQEMLTDFNDIDYYRIDGDALLGILTEAESFRTPEHDNIYLRRFQDHVQVVQTLYTRLTPKLLQQQCAYPGLLARYVCDNWEEIRMQCDQWDTIVFAGFNALNTCESFVLQELVKSGKGQIAWDIDTWFCREEQESGFFFRAAPELLRNFAQPDTLLTTEKQVLITGAPQRTGQAKTIGIALERFLQEHSDVPFERIAIVLADESLLFPVLYALPERCKPINISMGYPLADTPAFSLLLTVLRLFSEARTEHGWPFAIVNAICMHPLIIGDAHRAFLHNCETMNIHTILPEQITVEAIPDPVIRAVFTYPSSPEECIHICIDLINMLKDTVLQDPTAHETVYMLYTTLMHMSDSYRSSKLSIDVRSFCMLLIDLLQAQKIPFSGEPLEGIQIMGMLETRALDFDVVFVAACNEGVLPKGKGGMSFIPYDIRKSFGLPTFEHRDAVFAYHFYRLLRRARYLHLVYNNQPGDGFSTDKGEKSRFIEQIAAEIAPLGTWNLSESTTVFKATASPVTPLSIPKTQTVYARIGSKPWSATALSAYLSCPMQYYFRYIARLKEADELEEEASAQSIGTIIHEVLETLYRKVFAHNQHFDDAHVQDALDAVRPLVCETYKNHTHITPQHGKNALIAETLTMLCTEFIRTEITHPPLRIRHFEKNLHVHDHPLLIGDRAHRTSFTGRIDRIDTIELNGIEYTRIVDYKTGKAEPVSFDIQKLFDSTAAREEFTKKRAVFQVLYYWYLLCIAGEIAPEEAYCAGIGFVRTPSDGIQLCGYRSDTLTLRRNEHQVPFEHVLAAIIGEILDPTVPFTQTDDEKRCEFCAYRTVCMR